jgi:hypothetical protein
MQGKLDEAREAYLKVGGGYQQYAKLQADRLAEPAAKATYDWLKTARAPQPRAPWGPGTPGERPAFSEGELALPGAEGAATSSMPGVPPTAPAASIEDLLKGLELDYETPGVEGDRYAPGATPPAAEGTSGETAQEESTSAEAPAEVAPPTTQENATPPATEAPADAPATEAPSGESK